MNRHQQNEIKCPISLRLFFWQIRSVYIFLFKKAQITYTIFSPLKNPLPPLNPHRQLNHHLSSLKHPFRNTNSGHSWIKERDQGQLRWEGSTDHYNQMNATNPLSLLRKSESPPFRSSFLDYSQWSASGSRLDMQGSGCRFPKLLSVFYIICNISS